MDSSTRRRWRYRAADARGTLVEGEQEGASEREVVDSLRRKELWAIDVWPRDEKRRADPIATGALNRDATGAALTAPNTFPRGLRVLAHRRDAVPPGALAVVTRAMATLLAAGVPLDRALSFAAAQSPDGALRAAFVFVRHEVRGGKSLAEALGAHAVFSQLFVALAKAGEATGKLDETLSRLADHLERADELRSKLRTALLYPILLGCASVIGVTVILLVVVPRFSSMLTQVGGTLPMSTRMLVFASHVIARGWFVWVPAIVLLGIGVNRWMQVANNRKRWHAARLHWPVVGSLERSMAAARYTRTLGLALPTGLGLLPAMQLARASIENMSLTDELEHAEQRVRDGAPLAQSIGNTLPPLATQLLDAGETSGALASLASRAADTFESEVERGMTRAVSLVEPVMILGFGGVVGFVALALLQAIYGINAKGL